MDFTPTETAYRAYIDEHVANVKEVWERMQPLLKGKFFLCDWTWHCVNGLVAEHDASKYETMEFDGYRNYFYPIEGEHRDKAAFNLAWNHHQKTNPHHWEYWCLIGRNGGMEALNMPFAYIFEMLCDWTAMSLKFRDTPSAFYEKNKEAMTLSDSTRRTIEAWLPKFDSITSKEEKE